MDTQREIRAFYIWKAIMGEDGELKMSSGFEATWIQAPYLGLSPYTCRKESGTVLSVMLCSVTCVSVAALRKGKLPLLVKGDSINNASETDTQEPCNFSLPDVNV